MPTYTEIRLNHGIDQLMIYKIIAIFDDFIDGDAKEATEEYDCTGTTQGVFM